MSVSKGVALITGAAQGIGRGIALRLARDGFDVALNDFPFKCDQLRAVADKIQHIGQRTLVVPADVAIEAGVKEMIQDVTEKLGGLDVMVANAGIATISPSVSTELDEWERVMAVNARGTFLCYKHAAKQMIAQERGGRIIGASSIVGKQGHSALAAYSASKFAIRGMTHAFAQELGRYKITVNAYAPGFIETPMLSILDNLEGLPGTEREILESIRNFCESRFIKHVGQPEDVASIVGYLASKEAHFVTGGYPFPIFVWFLVTSFDQDNALPLMVG